MVGLCNSAVERTFQDYFQDLAGELLKGARVEFLPARESPHTDPIYPVRFKPEAADLIVGFRERMVLLPEGKRAVGETVVRVVRLIRYFTSRTGS